MLAAQWVKPIKKEARRVASSLSPGVERGVPDERHKGAAADRFFAYLAEVPRARSHASHHIFMISNGTTAQNRYGIGTSK